MPVSCFLGEPERKGEEDRGTQRESSGSRVSKDEEIRWRWRDQYRSAGAEDKAKQQAASSSAPRTVYFSLSDLSILSWLMLLYAQFIFQQFLPTIAAHSILSIRAYLPVVLPHLQLSLFSSTSWCSSMYCSRRVSESVSPPTPAVGDQPLSCQMMLRVALPLSSLSIQPFPFSSPPLPHTHACI